MALAAFHGAQNSHPDVRPHVSILVWNVRSRFRRFESFRFWVSRYSMSVHRIFLQRQRKPEGAFAKLRYQLLTFSLLVTTPYRF